MFEMISAEEMEQVGGGAGTGHTVTAPKGTNGRLLDSLKGIQTSLDDLGKNQNQNGGFLSGANGMMFMTMATVAMSRRQQTTVVCGSRGCYWRSSW